MPEGELTGSCLLPDAQPQPSGAGNARRQLGGGNGLAAKLRYGVGHGGQPAGIRAAHGNAEIGGDGRSGVNSTIKRSCG